MTWPFRRRLLLALVAVPIAAAAWFALGFEHSIANGGEIFGQVSDIRNAVPLGATKMHIQSSEASWIAGCSEVPGSRSGWTTDQISISFVDSNARRDVVDDIARALTSQGWRRHDSSPGPHRGKLPHWTLDVNSAHDAQAWAFPVGPGTHHWAFTASWRPPGPVGQGCP
jgi:hypothetical protein